MVIAGLAVSLRVRIAVHERECAADLCRQHALLGKWPSQATWDGHCLSYQLATLSGAATVRVPA
jgi:hypothetical protein